MSESEKAYPFNKEEPRQPEDAAAEEPRPVPPDPPMMLVYAGPGQMPRGAFPAPAAPEKPAEPEDGREQVGFCRNCGCALSEKSRFCPNCGSELERGNGHE